MEFCRIAPSAHIYIFCFVWPATAQWPKFIYHASCFTPWNHLENSAATESSVNTNLIIAMPYFHAGLIKCQANDETTDVTAVIGVDMNAVGGTMTGTMLHT